MALASTCTTLRKHGATNPYLWASLQLQLPDQRMPQLAAWLGSKRGAVHSLTLDIEISSTTDGFWTALEPVLEPLTMLTSLQLSNNGGHYTPLFQVELLWTSLAQPPTA